MDADAFARLAHADHALAPDDCAALAARAAALVDVDGLDREGDGQAVLLWRDAHSEGWLNTWWAARDTGFHDHDGSAVGVHVLRGVARNEALVYGAGRRVHAYGAGESFSFPATGIHRMDHEAGAVTIHVYSPPLRAIGHYDVEDGELRRTACPADEPTPPSAALSAALG
jgi:Cysteine dioxygenase type I